MSDLTSMQTVDGAKVMCEFEFIAGEPAQHSGRTAGPASPAVVTVTRVYINDEWIDAAVMHPKVIARFEEDIANEMMEQAA